VAEIYTIQTKRAKDGFWKRWLRVVSPRPTTAQDIFKELMPLTMTDESDRVKREALYAELRSLSTRGE